MSNQRLTVIRKRRGVRMLAILHLHRFHKSDFGHEFRIIVTPVIITERKFVMIDSQSDISLALFTRSGLSASRIFFYQKELGMEGTNVSSSIFKMALKNIWNRFQVSSLFCFLCRKFEFLMINQLVLDAFTGAKRKVLIRI